MQTDTRPRADISAVEEAAERLLDAASSGRPCAPVRDLIDPLDIGTAYAVQRHVTAARTSAGARVVGRKVGLTSTAVQRQLGVDRPDFGVLFDDMAHRDGDVVRSPRLLQPRVEAEVAFVLGSDLDDPDAVDPAAVRGAVAHAVAALELVDSRIAGWDISYADTVADNASGGAFVLGSEAVELADVEPRDVQMTMHINGRLVSQGRGIACLGDPLVALAWLARTALELGDPLRAGEVVLSGALGPMVPLQPGDRVDAEVTGLGTVSASLGAEDEA